MTTFADLPLTPDNVEQLAICGFRVFSIADDGRHHVGIALKRANDEGAKPWLLVLSPESAADLAADLRLSVKSLAADLRLSESRR